MSFEITDPASYPYYLIDPYSVECFGGVHPAAGVGADGEVTFWLFDVNHDCDGPPCCTVRAPEHERLGRLPREVRERLGLVHRCGAPTWAGRPCRQLVTAPSEHCGVHGGL